MNSNKIRLFIGIELSKDFLSELLNLKERYSALDNIRWVPKENLHITICFIGDTENNLLPNVIETIEEITKSHKSFTLEHNSICYAPKGKKAYMIWEKLSSNNLFEEIAHSHFRKLVKKNSKVKFTPHITLARFNKKFIKEDVDTNININTKSISVEKLVLWKSELKATGSVYTKIKEFYLNN